MPIRAFAYPHGDVDQAIQHLIGACGYSYGLSCQPDLSRFQDSLLTLPRIEVVGSDGLPQFRGVVHLDDLDPESTDGVIVNIPRFAWNDYLVLQPFEIRQALDLFGVHAGQTAGGGVCQRSGCTSRHNGPLHLQQFGKAAAYFFHRAVAEYALICAASPGIWCAVSGRCRRTTPCPTPRTIRWQS